MFETVKPPRAASLLLSLFAGEPDFPQVEGDLSEEFHQLVLWSGPDAARQWYWREALRNARAFVTRQGSINVLGTAALCIAVYRLVGPVYFRWLRGELASVPRVPGLGFFLMTLSEIAITSALGVLTGRILSGRGSLLRLAFTGFYLLQVTYFISTSGIYTWWLQEPVQITKFLAGFFCINVSFWIGSLWSERRERQQLS